MAYVDDILRAYARGAKNKAPRPVAGDVNLAPLVMARINRDGIVMRPAWTFRLRRLEFGLGLAAAVGAAVVALNLSLEIMDRTGALEFMNFGPNGIPAIASSIPVDYLGIAVLAALIGYIMVRRTPWFSHHSHLRLTALYALFVLAVSMSFSLTPSLSGAILALNPAGRSLFTLVTASTASPYRLDENQAIIGRVTKSSATEIVVETPAHTVLRLQGTPNNTLFTEPFFTEGQIVKAVGEMRNGVFFVSAADTMGPRGLNYFSTAVEIRR